VQQFSKQADTNQKKQAEQHQRCPIKDRQQHIEYFVHG
jgi:hypothetical protein